MFVILIPLDYGVGISRDSGWGTLSLWLSGGIGDNGLGVGGIKTGLNQTLALRDGNERLQLRGREGVHMTSLGGNQEEGLGPSKGCELIGLFHQPSLPFAEGNLSPGLVIDKLNGDLPSTSLSLHSVPLFSAIIGTIRKGWEVVHKI